MSRKTFDVIIFGASGYTGRCITKHFYSTSPTLKWAIAGRNYSKLSILKSELILDNKFSLPDILIGDVEDVRGLKDMFSTTKLVINCTGPYKNLGYDIIEACLGGIANYMDICNEPLFMEKCFLRYHDQAISLGLLIIHACGFDSVPADFGCLYSMQQYPNQMCSSIESFLVIRCPKGLRAHYTAFECAVRSSGDIASTKKVRKEISSKYHLQIKEIGPKLKKRPKYYYNKELKKYVLPFTGADASVVKMSQRSIALLDDRMIWPQFNAYVAISSIFNATATSFYEGVCSSLSGFALGRSLLLQFPEYVTGGVFSHTGPTSAQLEDTKFEFHLFAKGYSSNLLDIGNNDNSTNVEAAASMQLNDHRDLNKPSDQSKKSMYERDQQQLVHHSHIEQTSVMNKTCNNLFAFNVKKSAISPPADKNVHVVVSGPEPLYVATPIILISLMHCFFEERDNLPIGGVFTPCGAFYKCSSVFDRLRASGISFTVVESNISADNNLYLNELISNSNEDILNNEVGRSDKEYDDDDPNPSLETVQEEDSTEISGTFLSGLTSEATSIETNFANMQESS